MRRRLTEITIVILGILIGALTNVATGVLPEMLPAEWRQYLWLSWLPLGVVVLLVVVLEWRASRDPPPAPSAETHSPAPLAQNTVTNSAGVSGGGEPRVQSNVAVGDNTGTVIGTQIGTQIINQAHVATSLHQLRAPVADFVGREKEIAQLVQQLRQAAGTGAAAAISGVRGMGGIGKTELAYAVAAKLGDAFLDAQLLIDLRGASTNPLTPEAALQAVIRAFEREARLPDDIDQLRSIYCSTLAGKRALILADDAKDAAQVCPLLPPSGCALLITTRNRFALPGMQPLDLGTLPPAEAEQLLLEICPRIGAQAVQLAGLCGYLALALRVSASLLANSSRSVERYLEQLAAERLKHLSDPDDPQASVEASLRLTYDALAPAAQAALGQVSVFPASFDLAAAQAIVQIEGDAEAFLDLLQRRSLLEWDAQVQRYSLHELVRVFAAARLDDADVVRLRHVRYYADVAAAADNLYLEGGTATLTGLALFDKERANIDAGWDWACAHAGDSDADALLLSYADATAYTGNLRYDTRRERIPQLEALLAAAQRSKNPDAEGVALGNLGLAYITLGEARRAIDYFEQDLAIARAIGDQRSEGNALGSLGLAHAALGDTHQAISFYEQDLAIARTTGDRRGEGITLGNLGEAYAVLGDVRQAISCYEQSFVIAREIGDQRSEGQILGSMGNAYATLGKARQAIGFYEQALTVFRDIGDRLGEGNSLGNLGIAYQDLGETRQAIDYYEQRLVIAREISDRRGEALGSWNLGLALEEQGQLAQAVAAMQVRVDFEREIGHPDAEKNAARVEQVRRQIKG
jgi:tetratricopeptide (TPR) repeat protein